MSEKTKVYIFEKFEVFLIFAFMILIAITSFVFGVKVGKSYSFQTSGLTVEDRKQVELQSKKEELVDKNVKVMESQPTVNPEKFKEEMDRRLEGKISESIKGTQSPTAAPAYEEKELAGHGTPKTSAAVEEKSEKLPAPQTVPETNEVAAMPSVAAAAPTVAVDTPKPQAGGDKKAELQYSGKFTIQLGSHRSKEEAEKFADGFRIRGYNPIISEVDLGNKGTWYRVSLGVFENVTDAKDYIITKEKALFQGQDYVIVRFE
ncbi:MAG: SPOR domain-containing protein [Pseudomonadota bacterium]